MPKTVLEGQNAFALMPNPHGSIIARLEQGEIGPDPLGAAYDRGLEGLVIEAG